MNETIVKTEKLTELKNLVSELEKLEDDYLNPFNYNLREQVLYKIIKLIKTL